MEKTIAEIAFRTHRAARERAHETLFNIRIERQDDGFHIVHGALSPGGPDITHNETKVTPTPPKPPVVEVKVKRPKEAGACAIVRDFTRANPELSREQVVAEMLTRGINKGTASIQFAKVKRGEV